MLHGDEQHNRRQKRSFLRAALGGWHGNERVVGMKIIRRLNMDFKKLVGLIILMYTVMITGALAALPREWQLGVPEPVSPVAVRIHEFHDYLLWLIAAISLFVLVLMIYVCFRFKASNNPNPTKTTHNTFIEILWTAVPVLILVIVAVPSFKTLYYGCLLYTSPSPRDS